MDTSPEYIKQCDRAEEIQKLLVKDYIHSFYAGSDRRVWLPRQDQLQKMVGSGWRYPFYSFMWWYSDVDIGRLEKTGSMEQLWLAFVMKEKYGKTWNEEEWINVE